MKSNAQQQRWFLKSMCGPQVRWRGTRRTSGARRHNFGPMEVLSNVLQSNLAVSPMRHLSVWVAEFIKLLVGRRLHPLLTQCPICQQTVHLHVDGAGRRHAFAHARGLYEGCHLCKHYVGKIKCLGSGALMFFDPRPCDNLCNVRIERQQDSNSKEEDEASVDPRAEKRWPPARASLLILKEPHGTALAWALV
jgi:hypothetical protein